MKVGRELDALIAEKVMGWKLAQAPDGTEFWDNGIFCGGKWMEEWNPSTSIADAWLVVEKFHNQNQMVRISNTFGGDWSCTIHGGSVEERVVSETAPLVICLTALCAVGVEEKG